MGAPHGSREGEQFGPYRLKRLLGRGGMGDVYEAEDTAHERMVALKLLSDAFSLDPVFRQRMQREARTAGRLQEPHVVPIHNFGEIDGQLYVDMRLIDGTDVAKILSRYGPLAPPRAVAIVRQIASALDAAHAAGVVHRDVKPENILVTGDDFAYLVDFGIASATTDEKLTQMGTAVGSWKYMAPERFTDAEVTYRVDIYSLACVLYECLTGSSPYRGNQVALITAHMQQPIPRPTGLRPGIPPAFDDVIARGMAKNPADRYASAGDLAMAAHKALATPDRDRATDILTRTQVAALRPANFTGQPTRSVPPSPAPPTSPAPQGPAWTPPPAPTRPGTPSGPIPQPTPSTGVPAWGAGTAPWPGQSGAPPYPAVGPPAWGQPPAQPGPSKRNPWPWVGAAAAIFLFIVVLVVGITLVFRGSSTPSPTATPASTPSSSESSPSASPSAGAVKLQVLDDGVLVGSPTAPTTIDIFNEPICPPCGAFNRSFGSQIETAVDNNKLAVRYHLLNFLDEKSASKNYSTRAVAATYCIAAQNDPTLYAKFYTGIFANDFQPKEDASSDRTDSELAQLAQTLGADSSVLGCINAGDDLATARTKATNGNTTLDGFNGTGTPFVWDGKAKVNINDANWLTNLTR